MATKLNEFLTGSMGGWMGAYGNLIFLRPSRFDSGAWMSSSESADLWTGSHSYRTSITFGENSRLTLGGGIESFQKYHPNLNYKAVNVQLSVANAEFKNGGELDFSSSAGAGTPGGSSETLETAWVSVANRTDTWDEYGNYFPSNTGSTLPKAPGADAWHKSSGSKLYATQDSSAYGFRSSGSLTVLSDLSALIVARSGNSDEASSITERPIGTYLDYYLDVTGKDIAYIDVASGNTSNSAALRAASLIVDKRMTGALIAKTDVFSITKLKNSGTISGNTITANGIWTDGELRIRDLFTGSITSGVSRVTLANDISILDPDKEKDKAKNAAVSNNKIGAYGLRGGDIYLSRVSDTAKINVSLDTVYMKATSQGGDGSSAAMTGNTFQAIAIEAASLTLNGAFNVSLNSSITNIMMEREGGSTWSEGGLIEMYGIRVSGGISTTGNMGGNFTLSFDNSMVNERMVLTSMQISGVRADSLKINGLIRTDITISMNHFNSGISDTDFISGYRVNNFVAEAFDGSISIQTTNFNSYVRVGMYVDNSMGNDNDGSFDLIGTISVAGGSSRNFGVMGFKQSGMNIRVSGSIDVENGYAFFAGTVDSLGYSTRYTTDDRLEIAAGAYVNGMIELYNGQNTLIIDSNARLESNLNTRFGTVNVEFALNDFALNGTGPIAGKEQQAIIQSNSQATSVYVFTVNLNGVDVADVQAGNTHSYKIYEGNILGWDNRVINFKYQGVTGSVTVNGGIASWNGIQVQARLDGNSVYFDVLGMNPVGDQKLADLVYGDTVVDYDARTVTLSWEDKDGSVAENYEVEYRIIKADGTVGKSIVRIVSKAQLTGDAEIDAELAKKWDAGGRWLNLKLEEGEKIEWRVRQNLGNGDKTSDWTDAVTSGTMEEIPWVLDAVEGATFEQGQSAASAVSTLTWDKVTDSSNGVSHYVIQYFQTLNKLDENSIDWDQMAVVEKHVTNNQLLVSGLNNLEYFYWRIQVVDNKGKVSEWSNGELFKVYTDDTVAPTFTNRKDFESSVGWYIADPLVETENTMKPTLSWDYAIDDRAGVSAYIIKYRAKGSNEWTVLDTVVHDGNHRYTWTCSNKNLIKNGNYEWAIVAVDYIGKETSSNPADEKSIFGEWEADAVNPVLSGKTEYKAVWDGVVPGEKEADLFITVSFNWQEATDADSGVARVNLKYRLAGTADWTTVVLSSTTTDWTRQLLNGRYEYQLTAVDVAGNVSDVVSGEWLGDVAGPTFADSELLTDSVYNYTTKTTTVTFKWTEALDQSETLPNSGMAKYLLTYASEDGKTTKTYTITDLNLFEKTLSFGGSTALADGKYTWTIQAVDVAGNKSATLTGDQFIIDTEGPSGTFGTLGAPTINVSYLDTVTGGGSSSSGNGGLSGGDVEDNPIVIKVVESVSATFTINGTFNDTLSGVCFLIQVSDSKDFSSRVNEFVTSTKTLTLDNTLGFGAGALSGMGTVYWRVQAIDAVGNRTNLWVNGESFSFKDSSGAAITDTVAPTKVTGLSFSRIGKKSTFTWGASTDVFGVKSYTLRYSTDNGKTWITRDNIVDTSIMSEGLADGKYIWSVKADDYTGHNSGWSSNSSFVIDTTAPIFNEKSVTVTAIGSDLLFTWTAATDNIEMGGYTIQLRLSGQKEVITITGITDTQKILYSLEKGTYDYRVWAYDAAGNLSTKEPDWVNGQITINPENDPGNSFDTAYQLTEDVSYSNTIGIGSDLADYYKFTVTATGMLSVDLSGVTALGGKNSGIRVEIYNSSLKRVRSFTVRSGDSDFSFLANAGDNYYIVVKPGSNGSSSQYDVTVDVDAFPTSQGYGSFDEALANKKTLVNGETTIAGGWVGYGDAADYYFIDAERAGQMNVSVNIASDKTTLRVSIFDANKKKLRTVTLNSNRFNDFSNIFKDILVQGDVYLMVESGDKGKGKQNSEYTLTVDDSYFAPATEYDDFVPPADPSALDPRAKIALSDDTANFRATGSTSGWVGYGDAKDCYYIDAKAGNLDVSLNIASVKTSLKVSLYDANGKRLKSVTLNSSRGNDFSNIFKDVMVTGPVYLMVESGDKGKGKQNSDYTVSVEDNYFKDVTGNVDFATAESVDLSSGNVSKSGWTGYGEKTGDYYKFTTSGLAGSVTLSVSAWDANQRLKVTIYDANGKRIASVGGFSGSKLVLNDKLINGDFYVVVQSQDNGKGKQNSDYTILANETFFPARTENNSINDATAIAFNSEGKASDNGWVGYGDSADYYKFTLDQAGKVDLDLAGLEAGYKAGSQVRLKLFDVATGRSVALDGNFTSRQDLLAGEYAVAVEISNENKFRTNYDLTVSKLA